MSLIIILILAATAVGLWQSDKKALALVPGALAAVLTSGWIMNMALFLLVKIAILAAVAGLVVAGAVVTKKSVKKKFSSKKAKKTMGNKSDKSLQGAANQEQKALNPSDSQEIEDLLKELKKQEI